jgi:hypothetical protein
MGSDVPGASQECDAKHDKLVALRRCNDLWHLPHDELKITHHVFEKVFGQTLEDFGLFRGQGQLQVLCREAMARSDEP